MVVSPKAIALPTKRRIPSTDRQIRMEARRLLSPATGRNKTLLR